MHLPGGELNAGEQKALIEMLAQLREHKKSVHFPLAVSRIHMDAQTATCQVFGVCLEHAEHIGTERYG